MGVTEHELAGVKGTWKYGPAARGRVMFAREHCLLMGRCLSCESDRRRTQISPPSALYDRRTTLSLSSTSVYSSYSRSCAQLLHNHTCQSTMLSVAQLR